MVTWCNPCPGKATLIGLPITMFPRRDLSHPLWAQSKCFLMFRWTIPCFNWLPSPLVFSLGTNEKSLSLSSFATSLQAFVHIDEILPEPFLLQAAQFLLSLPYMRNVLDPSLT